MHMFIWESNNYDFDDKVLILICLLFCKKNKQTVVPSVMEILHGFKGKYFASKSVTLS